MPKNHRKRAAPQPSGQRCYAQQQPLQKHETPRKRPCLINIQSSPPPALSIPTLASPANEPQPPLPLLLFSGDALLNLQNDLLIAQLQRDAQLNMVRAQEQEAQKAAQTRSLMDDLLAKTGVRRVINGCVVERVYK